MNEQAYPPAVDKRIERFSSLGENMDTSPYFLISWDWLIGWLIDWTLFLNGEDISTKADSHICRCYSTTNNQDIHSQILWQKAIDKYSISNNNKKKRERAMQTETQRD